MNPLGILMVLACCGVIFKGSRISAALAIMFAVLYIPQSQQIYFFFNFTAQRIILLAACLRIRSKKESEGLILNPIDKCLLAYTASLVVFYTVRNGTFTAFNYEVGQAYNIVLSYYAFRCLIPNLDDLKVFTSKMAVFIVPFVLFMMVEGVTGRDVFADFFPGIESISWVRGDHVRARAAFRAPITAGGFGGALAPLFAVQYFAFANRGRMLFGFACCVIIVMSSHSSGPLMGLLAGLVTLVIWKMRHNMRLFRRMLLGLLILLHLVMKAPVWFLIARAGEIVGGDAYYRAALIDAFVNRFSSWWLMGVSDTSEWMPTLINGGADITNQLVAAGVEGGLTAMVLFVLLMGKCFQMLGKGRGLAEPHSHEDEWLFWGIGASLVAHLTNQTSVTYFDQMHIAWYMMIAIASSTVGNYKVEFVAPEDEQVSLDPVGMANAVEA